MVSLKEGPGGCDDNMSETFLARTRRIQDGPFEWEYARSKDPNGARADLDNCQQKTCRYRSSEKCLERCRDMCVEIVLNQRRVISLFTDETTTCFRALSTHFHSTSHGTLHAHSFLGDPLADAECGISQLPSRALSTQANSSLIWHLRVWLFAECQQ